jgi:hypothetical protein
MKVYIVQNVARQVEGDLIVVQVEKGFISKDEANKYLTTLPRQAVQKVRTEVGEIDCFCVRGVYEVDIAPSTDNMIAPKNKEFS